MKTLRIALIAMVLACTVANLAYADEVKTKPRKVCHINFDKATQVPGLMYAISVKIDPSFLEVLKPLYLVEVQHKGVNYKILGSRQDWVHFFWHLQADKTNVRANEPPAE